MIGQLQALLTQYGDVNNRGFQVAALRLAMGSSREVREEVNQHFKAFSERLAGNAVTKGNNPGTERYTSAKADPDRAPDEASESQDGEPSFLYGAESLSEEARNILAQMQTIRATNSEPTPETHALFFGLLESASPAVQLEIDNHMEWLISLQEKESEQAGPTSSPLDKLDEFIAKIKREVPKQIAAFRAGVPTVFSGADYKIEGSNLSPDAKVAAAVLEDCLKRHGAPTAECEQEYKSLLAAMTPEVKKEVLLHMVKLVADQLQASQAARLTGATNSRPKTGNAQLDQFLASLPPGVDVKIMSV